jgi:hypothetical protein
MPPKRTTRSSSKAQAAEKPSPVKSTKAKKAAPVKKTTKNTKSAKKAVTEEDTKEAEATEASSNSVSDVAAIQPITIKDTTIEKAVAALSKWNQDQQVNASKKDLFEAEDSDLPLYMHVAGNKFFASSNVVKPRMLQLPHPIYDLEDARVCLFVKDGLLTDENKQQIELLKSEELKNLANVITVKELKTKYHQYEARRKLLSEYDIFLTDSSIANMAPKLLGKTFFQSSKFPVTINITENKELSIHRLKTQFVKALNSVGFMLPMSTSAAFKLGMLGQDLNNLKDNIHAITKYLERFSIRFIQLKLLNSPSLPVYINKKVYTEDDVLKDGEEENNDVKTDKHTLSIYAEGLKELGLDEEEALSIFGGKKRLHDDKEDNEEQEQDGSSKKSKKSKK